MSDAIDDIEKSKRGRPRTDSTPLLVRLQPAQLAKLDQWIEGQSETISRPEAIRRLIDQVVQ